MSTLTSRPRNTPTDILHKWRSTAWQEPWWVISNSVHMAQLGRASNSCLSHIWWLISSSTHTQKRIHIAFKVQYLQIHLTLHLKYIWRIQSQAIMSLCTRTLRPHTNPKRRKHTEEKKKAGEEKCTGFQPVSLLTHHLAHYSPLWRFWVMQHYYHHKFGDDPRPVLALLGQKYHKLLDINQNPQVYSAAALNDCLRFMSVFLNSQHGDIWHQTSLQSSVHVEQREYLSSRPVAHNIYKVCVQIPDPL